MADSSVSSKWLKTIGIGLCLAITPLGYLLSWIYVIAVAVRRHIPEGKLYFLWVFCLFFIEVSIAVLFNFNQSARQFLVTPSLATYVLIFDAVSVTIITLLIFRTVSGWNQPNINLPLTSPRTDLISIALILTIIALRISPYLFPEITAVLNNEGEAPDHPLILALQTCASRGLVLGVVFGFVGIGILGPISEEFIFRSLFVRNIESTGRYKKIVLTILVSLLFATLHLPISFVYPFIFALIVMVLRIRTRSLLIPIFLHIGWNLMSCIEVILLN